MTPRDIVKKLLEDNAKFIDECKDLECTGDDWIQLLNVGILEKAIQKVIDRSNYPVSNERISQMSNILENNEKQATKARSKLESLYHSPERNQNEPPKQSS